METVESVRAIVGRGAATELKNVTATVLCDGAEIAASGEETAWATPGDAAATEARESEAAIVPIGCVEAIQRDARPVWVRGTAREIVNAAPIALHRPFVQ